MRRGYLCFDRDPAGINAVLKGGLTLVRAGIEPLVISLPEGQDPDDFLRTGSKEGFLELVADAEPLLGFRLGSLDFNPHVRKYDALHSCLPILASIPDAIKRGVALESLENLLGLPKEHMVRGLESYLRERTLTADLLPLLSSSQGELECGVLGIYLRWPKLRDSIKETFPVELFSHDLLREIATWIYGNINGSAGISNALRDIHSPQIDFFHPQELSSVVEGVIRGVVGDTESLLLIMHRMFYAQDFESPGSDTLAGLREGMIQEKRVVELKEAEDEILVADAHRNPEGVLSSLQRYVELLCRDSTEGYK